MILLDALGRLATCVASAESAADLLEGAPPLPHIVVLRTARAGMSLARLTRLHDPLARRMSIDLLILAGEVSAAPDVSSVLCAMALFPLGADAGPAAPRAA